MGYSQMRVLQEDKNLLMWEYQQMFFVKDNDCAVCKERSKWSPTEC